MKILEICTVNFKLTGIPIHIRNYYNELKKEHHIDIVARNFDHKILRTMPLENKTKLYDLPRKKNLIKYFLSLKKIVKAGNYDVIHIHGNSATMSLEILACSNSNAKIITHTHNTEYQAKFLSKLLSHYLNHHTNARFASSMEAGKKLYGNNDFQVIKNGINVANVKYNKNVRNRLRNKYGIRESTFVIGHIGLFWKQKNQEFLLKVAKLLIEKDIPFKIVLIGDGENKEIIQQQIESSNLEKYFLILPSTDKINEYYSMFDLFVLPSRWEGLGMVAIEAQYAGLPCLLSEFVPKAAKISDSVTFLPLDANKWSNEIVTKSYTSNDRNNLHIYESYDIEACAKELEKQYYQILGR